MLEQNKNLRCAFFSSKKGQEPSREKKSGRGRLKEENYEVLNVPPETRADDAETHARAAQITHKQL